MAFGPLVVPPLDALLPCTCGAWLACPECGREHRLMLRCRRCGARAS